MLSICIVRRGAIVPALLVMSGVAVGAANAQTTDAGATGRPLQLLQNIKPGYSAKTDARAGTKKAAQSKAQTRAAAHSVGKSKVADKTSKTRMAAHSESQTELADREQEPAVIAQAPALPKTPGQAWPAGSATPMGGSGTDTFTTSTPMQPGAAAGALAPADLVAGGQDVKIAASGGISDMDRAAANNGAAGSDPQPSAPAAAAAPKADSASAVVAQTPASQVGSTAWIMQVLAALGGAVAAGSVAWFLIGSAPQRTYS